MQSDIRVHFGSRLKEYRRLKGWSQEMLALESGLARSYVSGVERGLRNISLINIGRLAAALSVLPCEMLVFPETLVVRELVEDSIYW